MTIRVKVELPEKSRQKYINPASYSFIDKHSARNQCFNFHDICGKNRADSLI